MTKAQRSLLSDANQYNARGLELQSFGQYNLATSFYLKALKTYKDIHRANLNILKLTEIANTKKHLAICWQKIADDDFNHGNYQLSKKHVLDALELYASLTKEDYNHTLLQDMMCVYKTLIAICSKLGEVTQEATYDRFAFICKKYIGGLLIMEEINEVICNKENYSLDEFSDTILGNLLEISL